MATSEWRVANSEWKNERPSGDPLLATRHSLLAARAIALAREWIGTPYIHQASVKHAGCDCLGLLRGVWRELHGDEPGSIPPYSEDWAEATGEETLRNALAIHLTEIEKHDLAPGDIAVFRMSPHAPAKHCGIIALKQRSDSASNEIGIFPPPERGRSIREADRVGSECPSPDRCAIRPSLSKGGMHTLIHTRQNKRVSEEPFSLFWRRKLAYAFALTTRASVDA